MVEVGVLLGKGYYVVEEGEGFLVVLDDDFGVISAHQRLLNQ